MRNFANRIWHRCDFCGGVFDFVFRCGKHWLCEDCKNSEESRLQGIK